MQLGIDVGGSLTKVVLVDERDNQYFTFEPQQDEGLDQLLEQYPNTPICATGCGAPLLQAKYPDRVTITDELVSFCTGSRYYAGQLAWKQPYILTSLGTGTSIFLVSDEGSHRVTGTAVGGGTITGLASLLLGTRDFAQVVEMARRGDRRRVDLMVSDLYPDAQDSPVLSSLTAANFGNTAIAAATPPDLAAAILQLVMETVSLLSIQAAKTCGTEHILIAGSPTKNPLIKDGLVGVGRQLGHDFTILDHGPYFGAMGAILLCNQPQDRL